MPAFWYLCGKCSFWLNQPMFIRWKAYPVVSRHISVQCYVYGTTRCASDALHTAMKILLQQLLTPSFLQRIHVHSGERSYKDKQNLLSVCTLRQIIGGTQRRFTNIKSNRNMSRFDWKCPTVHEYRFKQSKWHFPWKYQKLGIVFFSKYANGLLIA